MEVLLLLLLIRWPQGLHVLLPEPRGARGLVALRCGQVGVPAVYDKCKSYCYLTVARIGRTNIYKQTISFIIYVVITQMIQ